MFQMSKSTGNFLTLAEATDKFSADGVFSFIFDVFPLESVIYFYRLQQ